jgi:hypothetical protein
MFPDLAWLLLSATALGGMGGLVVASVGWALLRRRLGSTTDVDELAVTVERLAKQARRERMQRVRAAAEPDPGAPPELLDATEGPPPGDSKAALWARLRASRGH